MKLLDYFKIDLKSFLLGSLGTIILFFLIVSIIVSQKRLENCVSEIPQKSKTELQSKINSLKQDICSNIIIQFENQHNI